MLEIKRTGVVPINCPASILVNCSTKYQKRELLIVDQLEEEEGEKKKKKTLLLVLPII